MTWLFEREGGTTPFPVDVLSEGLFACQASGTILPLEFAPAYPPPVQKPEVEEEVSEPKQGATQIRLMIDAAREEAAAETRASMELDCVLRVEAERVRVLSVLSLFEEERARWFRSSEQEIVDLALAIARRVLDREIKMDPMILRDIVEAAVSRVQDQSGVILRVAPECVADWRGAFASRPDLEVIPDSSVPIGECLVDTTFGRVELGVGVQLEEITERLRDMVGGPRRVLVRDGVLQDPRV